MLSSSGKTCKNFLLPPLSQLFIFSLHSNMQFSQSVLMQLCAESILNGFAGLKKKKKELYNNSNSKGDFFFFKPHPGHFSDPIYNTAQQTLPHLMWQWTVLSGCIVFLLSDLLDKICSWTHTWEYDLKEADLWRCSLVVICVMAFHNNFILHLLLDHKALQIILEQRNVFLFK